MKIIIVKKSSIFLFFLFCCTIASAQYNFKAITKWQQENTPTLGGRSTILILKDGKIVYANAVNDMSKKQKMIGKFVAKRMGKETDEVLQDFSEDNKIGIASCSKWLSAALVMTFVDEGNLKITDTVGKFLPILTVAGKGNITIEQCLSHTTGINGGSIKESIKAFNGAESMDDAIKIIAKYPLDSKPGESFRYSNTGLQIAGAVIEKISGKTFQTLFVERIGKPCNMIVTDFGEKALPVPAGSARSTAKEYLQFLEMILNKGVYNGKVVLKPASVEMMQRNYTYGKQIMYSPTEADSWGYGFGEWTIMDATENKVPDGVTSPGLFGTFPWIDNKLGYAAILFTYYIKNEGRNEKYKELKSLVDKAIQKN